MAVWTYAEAAPVVEAIAAAVGPHGFKADIVGSVAAHGASDKDVDVLISPVGAVTLDAVIDAVAAIERLNRLRECQRRRARLR